MIASGLNASWITVDDPGLYLGPGDHRVIGVWIHPPRLSSTTAGRHQVSVKMQPSNPDEPSLTADGVVVIEPFSECSITVLPLLQRSRRRAAFDVAVVNEGNQTVEARLHLVAADQALDGEFNPPAVAVPPGSASPSRLKARASRWRWWGEDRVVSFRVDATEPGRPAMSAQAALLQSPVFGPGLWGKVVRVVASVAILAAGWFFLARPWLDNRIDAAVERGASTGSGTGGGSGTATASDGAVEFVKLAPQGPPAETADASYTVPDGVTFLVTDIVLQNPNRDLGRARLVSGETVVYDWDLAAMASANEFQPRISPLPVEAATDLRFEVDCAELGDSGASACQVAVAITGRLVDQPSP